MARGRACGGWRCRRWRGARWGSGLSPTATRPARCTALAAGRSCGPQLAVRRVLAACCQGQALQPNTRLQCPAARTGPACQLASPPLPLPPLSLSPACPQVMPNSIYQWKCTPDATNFTLAAATHSPLLQSSKCLPGHAIANGLQEGVGRRACNCRCQASNRCRLLPICSGLPPTSPPTMCYCTPGGAGCHMRTTS